MNEVIKKNRLLLLLLSAILGLCMVWAFSAQKVYADVDDEGHVCINGIYYILDEGTSNAYVGGTDNLQGSATILERVDIKNNGVTKSYPVTRIEKGAFAGDNYFSNKGLTSISIPTTVTEIGDYAFANTGLTKVIIPYSVTKVGAYAFGYNATYWEDYEIKDDDWYGWKDPVKVPGFTIEAAFGNAGFNYGKQNGFFTYDPGVMSVTVNTSVANAAAIGAAIDAAGGNPAFIMNVTLGKNVKKIAANTFKQYGNVKTVTVQTKKLSKKKVKNSLKGSKVTKVKVQIGKKKVNKKYVKKYKKIFTKKNAGKKVKVGL